MTVQYEESGLKVCRERLFRYILDIFGINNEIALGGQDFLHLSSSSGKIGDITGSSPD